MKHLIANHCPLVNHTKPTSPAITQAATFHQAAPSPGSTFTLHQANEAPLHAQHEKSPLTNHY
jgi:hypothetical protein